MEPIEHKFNELIIDFGSFNFLYPIFELYEQRGEVGRRGSIIFEIRPKELGHNTPHVHAKHGDKSISISLTDYSILASNFPPKQEKKAVIWVKDNIEKLKSKWNEYHRYTIPVF